MSSPSSVAVVVPFLSIAPKRLRLSHPHLVHAWDFVKCDLQLGIDGVEELHPSDLNFRRDLHFFSGKKLFGPAEIFRGLLEEKKSKSTKVTS